MHNSIDKPRVRRIWRTGDPVSFCNLAALSLFMAELGNQIKQTVKLFPNTPALNWLDTRVGQ